MKKLFFACTLIIFWFCLHVQITANTSDDTDQLCKRFDISPVYSCIKGNNFYVLTENGPENAPKYGAEAAYDKKGSEIGYYDLDTGIYSKVFTKFYEDSVSGAIIYFTVDDAQENINFEEQVCVGQEQQSDRYYVTYSIKNKTARVTSLFRHFDDSAFFDKTKYPVYDTEYFRHTDKLGTLLKRGDAALKKADNLRFGGNNKLYVIRNSADDSEADEDAYCQELGYIDLDSDKYIRLLKKKEDPGKCKGQLSLVKANGNLISFQDQFYPKEPSGWHVYITYSLTAGSDTAAITDCSYEFHDTYAKIEGMIGTKVKISGFTDIGQNGTISKMLAIHSEYPDIRELVILNDKFYVVMKKSNLFEFGSIDTKTFKYVRLLQTKSEFGEYFIRLEKTADTILLENTEGFYDQGVEYTDKDFKSFYAAVVYEYSPARNTLKIKDAYLNTGFGYSTSQIKFTPFIGKKVRLKDFKDVEGFFNMQKMIFYSEKYQEIEDMFIYNNRLYAISQNGVYGDASDNAYYTAEIGCIDLKTNKYTRLLKKAESSEYHGNLRFTCVGLDNVEFFDYSYDSNKTIFYKLFPTGKSLKIMDIQPKGYKGLIGMKLKLSEFKDIDSFLTAKPPIN